MFFDKVAIDKIGFKFIGHNVLVSDKCSIYGAGRISIGDNVRIDDFSLLSSGCDGFIELHNHIHIAAYASLFGAGGIVVEDFCGVSSYTAIYSANDDYGGDYLLGPEMDEDCLNVIKATVKLGKYVTVGTHSVILPGVIIEEGAILGACSLASRSLQSWTIHGGIPAKALKPRSRGLLEKAKIMEERRKVK